MSLAIWDILHNTKKGLEWALEGKELDKYDALELVYEKIHSIIDEHGIIIGDLVD
jgi:hypothetical protein